MNQSGNPSAQNAVIYPHNSMNASGYHETRDSGSGAIYNQPPSKSRGHSKSKSGTQQIPQQSKPNQKEGHVRGHSSSGPQVYYKNEIDMQRDKERERDRERDY